MLRKCKNIAVNAATISRGEKRVKVNILLFLIDGRANIAGFKSLRSISQAQWCVGRGYLTS